MFYVRMLPFEQSHLASINIHQTRTLEELCPTNTNYTYLIRPKTLILKHVNILINRKVKRYFY